ncbi:MarR family transcriptional regulator [Aquibium sp. A9E412]|uniref:MarR family winged helix-turn-helix transcriptional regulator n=1 Tax=Aquibium sp. A9E412 TaxID=2976767 RepID=UPI0025AF4383|nr:MarR family winged helix-turn-helix transcriptional regulator [Aquibium sp. A9E412]MDN2566136.1 MarR family transcriptional regulator [Aquibium sp. A9E412]
MAFLDDPGTDNAPIEAWSRLLRVSRLLSETAEERLSAHGLPPLAWYDVLHELAAAEGGIGQDALARRMVMAGDDLARLLGALEAKDLVQRGGAGGQVIHVTDAGRRMHRRMWGVYGPSVSRLIADRLAPEEVAALSAALDRLRG